MIVCWSLWIARNVVVFEYRHTPSVVLVASVDVKMQDYVFK